jgi:hypothetical protein
LNWFCRDRPSRKFGIALIWRKMHGATRAKTIAYPSPIDPQRQLSNADSAAVLAGRVTLVVSIAGARDRLVHDLADGGRAPPALGAAAKAAIDLASRCRRSLGGEYGADVVVAQ